MAGELWSIQDIQKLKEIYPIIRREEILEFFPKRSWFAIRARAEKLKIRRYKFYWTKKQKDYLRKNYEISSRKEIMKNIPNKSWNTIKGMVHNSGWGLKRPTRFRFKPINKSTGRNTLRRKFIKKLGHFCHYPGCSWNQTIEINHIDGNKNNWQENNIEILCPNHHSITPTHSHQGNNGGKYK